LDLALFQKPFSDPFEAVPAVDEDEPHGDDSRTNLPDTEINNIRCDEENNAENQYDL
jgi:hypothetical protein